MTRFARAKGSKSSNERCPEDSTPWEVMKEQLENAKKENEYAKKREQAEKQRQENYDKFLKEHKSQKRKAVWCEFEEVSGSSSKKHDDGKKQKVKKSTANDSETLNTSSASTTDTFVEHKKEGKQKVKNTVSIDSETNNVIGAETNDTVVKTNKKVKQRTEKATVVDKEIDNVVDTSTNDTFVESKKKQKFRKTVNNDNVTDKMVSGNANDTFVKNKKRNNNEHKKMKDGKFQRKKVINDKSFQVIINGKEVDIERFDGFPILSKDAERLEELRRNMINKGIPKSEVQRNMKLERRRAEKALARLKRNVCYNCRKGGHNLSDCKELKSKIPGVGAADGVCFKCGSTEHRQFECKVQQDKEFRFASCFICKEQGHIARQCPDNPKGLYPNGGGCKLCGDVTHLKKDCPTVQNKKEETSIKLSTLDNTDNLEDIEYQRNTVEMKPQESCKKPKKIKF